MSTPLMRFSQLKPLVGFIGKVLTKPLERLVQCNDIPSRVGGWKIFRGRFSVVRLHSSTVGSGSLRKPLVHDSWLFFSARFRAGRGALKRSGQTLRLTTCNWEIEKVLFPSCSCVLFVTPRDRNSSQKSFSRLPRYDPKLSAFGLRPIAHNFWPHRDFTRSLLSFLLLKICPPPPPRVTPTPSIVVSMGGSVSNLRNLTWKGKVGQDGVRERRKQEFFEISI